MNSFRLNVKDRKLGVVTKFGLPTDKGAREAVADILCVHLGLKPLPQAQ